MHGMAVTSQINGVNKTPEQCRTEAGFSDGVYNYINGEGRVVGEAL